MNPSEFFERLNGSSVDTIVALDLNYQELSSLNIICRENKIVLTSGKVLGVAGLIFNDFGPDFEITDIDGEEYKEVNSKYS